MTNRRRGSSSLRQATASGPEHWGKHIGNRHYSLEVVQHPLRARMCGFGDKDRRPLAPAAVAKMTVKLEDDTPIETEDADCAFFLVTVDLWSDDGTREMNLVLNPSASSAERYIPAPPIKSGRRRGKESPYTDPSASPQYPVREPWPQSTQSYYQPGPIDSGLVQSPTVVSYGPPTDPWGYPINPYPHPPQPHPLPTPPSSQPLPPHVLPTSTRRESPTHLPDNLVAGPSSEPWHATEPPPATTYRAWNPEPPLHGHSLQSPIRDPTAPLRSHPHTHPHLITDLSQSPVSPTTVDSFTPTRNAAPYPSDPYGNANGYTSEHQYAHPHYDGTGLPTPPSAVSSTVDGSPIYPSSYMQQQHHRPPPLQPAPPPPPLSASSSTPTTYLQYSPTPSNIALIPRQSYTRTLVGPLSANGCRLLDENKQPGIFFLFQDLSIRTEGTFRLRLRLMNVGAPPAPEPGAHRVHTGISPVLAQTFTEPFTVFSAKRFPGVPDTTALSITFGNQGQKLPLRNRLGSSKGRKRRRSESDASDEESAGD